MRASAPALLASATAAGQAPDKVPPADIAAIVDAPPPPLSPPSPARDAMALVEYRPNPSIATLAEPMLRRAGLRITRYTGLSIRPLDGSPARRVARPGGATILSGHADRPLDSPDPADYIRPCE